MFFKLNLAVRVGKRPKIIVAPSLIVSLFFNFSVVSHNINPDRNCKPQSLGSVCCCVTSN